MIAREFSDEELTAYLDGEHEFTPVAEIESALRSDTRLKVRLDGMRIDRDALRLSFDAMLRKAPTMPALAATPGAPKGSFQTRKLAIAWQTAAAVALLTIGIGIGNWFGHPSQQLTGWRDYAAAYQSLYVKDTLAYITPNANDIDLELKQIADAVGKPVTLAQLSAGPALSFKRAQILNFNGAPLAQIAFLSNTGEPMALCIMRGTKISTLSFGSRMGLASASWGRDGFEYLLIGGKDQKLIEETAKRFSETI